MSSSALTCVSTFRERQTDHSESRWEMSKTSKWMRSVLARKGFLAKVTFRKHALSCRSPTNVQCWSDVTGTLHQAANSSCTTGKARQSLAFPLEIKLKCFGNDGVYFVGLYPVVLAAFPFGLLEPLHACSLLSSRIILLNNSDFWLRYKTAVLPICNPLEIL